MFDHYRDAFLEGAFRVEIAVSKVNDDTYVATWRGPNGQVIEVENSSQAQAHRDCSDKIREGVIKGTLVLGGA